jgi:NADH-quinone oxidoreductase subunit J
LKHEFDAFSKGVIGGVLKLASVGVILGLVMGSVYMSASMVFNNPLAPLPVGVDQVKMLSQTLFGNYIFAFEVIGALLLVIAIGAVTLSRIRGGTHAND